MAKKLTTAEILAAARKVSTNRERAIPKRQATWHELHVTSSDSDRIRDGLSDFWESTASVAKNTIPTNAWDTIICSVIDTGWIIAQTAKCVLPFAFPKRLNEIDKPIEHFHFPREQDVVSLFVSEHEQQLEALSDDCDDTTYCREFERLTNQKLRLLRETALVSQSLSELETIDGFKGAFAVIEPEVIYESNLIHLRGPSLPAPSAPETAIEVFSRLYHHSHKGVGKHCGMEFEDGELVAVSLDGGDTTDQTVHLLIEIDNLSHICRHVRQISLVASNVSDAGFHKLHALLPNVEVVR